MGERDIAFARFRLPVSYYKKGEYKFYVRNWKSWGLNEN